MGQEPTTNAPQEGIDTPAPAAAPPTEPSGMSLEDALAALKEVRKEAASHRTKLREFEAAEEQRRQASLSEAEKAREDAQKAVAERDALMEKVRRSEVLLAAKDKGIVDPEAAYALMDKSGIDWDDASTVAGALDALLAAKPYLAGTPAQPTPPAVPHVAPTSAARPGTQAAFTRAQIRDPQFFAANKDAIKAALKEGRILD